MRISNLQSIVNNMVTSTMKAPPVRSSASSVQSPSTMPKEGDTKVMELGPGNPITFMWANRAWVAQGKATTIKSPVPTPMSPSNLITAYSSNKDKWMPMAEYMAMKTTWAVATPNPTVPKAKPTPTVPREPRTYMLPKQVDSIEPTIRVAIIGANNKIIGGHTMPLDRLESRLEDLLTTPGSVSIKLTVMSKALPKAIPTTPKAPAIPQAAPNGKWKVIIGFADRKPSTIYSNATSKDGAVSHGVKACLSKGDIRTVSATPTL